ncbi:DUF4403 family protein [Frigoriflavimonas asaccharolytica]|uniref:DUF4403 family protein n=1 Tax=Frigoriflavimonas asaccharolytica TaxID=2735899 RepID=A0A8J8GAF8_9FLAO|nr:DUF4403 family protein [Frigoriflavimonas asaccharolytica]NRS92967.1 hypothetical protein [Frigoriflavimonas asaccharolytica]
MKNLISLFLIIFSTFGFAQVQFSNPTYVFPKIKSSITMPVQIPLSEISNMVNSSVQGLLFEDNSYEDNDNDQFKVKVWKAKPIRIVGGVKNNLIIAVPLKIWAEKGIGTFGLYNYQSTTFETEMYFSTELKVNSNWTIDTKTTANSFKWVTKPVLDFGRVKIPITSLVDKSLKDEQTKFTKIIDEQMKEQLNFQQLAITAWNLFAEPFEVSEDYKTWLKITPLKINLTPVKFYADQLQTSIGIDVYSETFTGVKPAISPTIGGIANFNFVPNLENTFTLNTTTNIPFEEATRIAEQTFLNKKYDFREGKSDITIEKIKVYGEEDRITIEAETFGTISGTSYISGIPVYDETKQKIVLSDTKFRLKTKNVFQKTLTLLFKSKIINMIEEEYGIPTSDLELSSKKSIEEAFNKEYYKGLKISGQVFKLKPQQILLTPNGITAIILTEAKLQLILKGM